jgi:isoleucyl-tRNA synthetase
MTQDGEGTGAPSPVEVQRRVLAYWDETGVPARAWEGDPNGPVFRFTEGPPTANGAPHLGHVVPRTLKDLQLRYRRMRGYRIVSSMAGWDCHGLPVEIEIEKRHGLKSKKEIEVYGVERFCDECRVATLSVADLWREMSRRQGYWLDYDHAYRTMDPPYIESVWWALKTLFDRGLLEKGHYVLPYCPRCETTLSSHEVAQGYRDATDPSVTVRLPLEENAGTQARRDLLVWTTTPWTLPANLLVAARGDLEYSVVREAGGNEVVLASAAVPRYFPGGADVVERLPGRDLAGRNYRPPFDAAGPGPGRYRVVLDDFVSAEEGTGFVHISPSFGPDDYRVGAREHVGVFDPLDSRGVFGDLVPLVLGKSFKAADPMLTKDLAGRGLLFRSETLRHTYPFCWRCDSALLYRAIDSWFVRTSRVTEALVRNNSTVLWIPEYLRDGRFGNFLTEAKDWALSRSRYWGTPLPVWMCPEGHPTCIGSFAELAERLGTPLPAPFDPHRVTVDRLVFPCPICAKESRREPYTIDVWFDSGAAPFAQFHYPFEPGPFDPKAPLDYVSEAIDQTRGWYYTLLVIATTVFDRPAYRANLTCEFLLNEKGQKMSKSKGDVAEPLALLERLGGDTVRWSFLSQDFTAPMKVTEATIQKASHRTLGALRECPGGPPPSRHRPARSARGARPVAPFPSRGGAGGGDVGAGGLRPPTGGNRPPGSHRRPFHVVPPSFATPVLGRRGPARASRSPRYALVRPRVPVPARRAVRPFHGRVGPPGGTGRRILGRFPVRSPERMALLTGTSRPPARGGDAGDPGAGRGRTRTPPASGGEIADPPRRAGPLRRRTDRARCPRGGRRRAPGGGVERQTHAPGPRVEKSGLPGDGLGRSTGRGSPRRGAAASPFPRAPRRRSRARGGPSSPADPQGPGAAAHRPGLGHRERDGRFAPRPQRTSGGSRQGAARRPFRGRRGTAPPGPGRTGVGTR